MNDLSVIDRFMQAFITYIDSGFGLLGGDVRFLSVTLIGIDVTLAALFWAMGGDQDVMGRFIKKILYVGAFAFIIGQFSALADIVFRSFAAAGITAGGGGITAADLLKPGNLASTGFTAAWPLLVQVSDLTGPVAFFTNFMTIAVLLFAWVIIILAFFVLALQMFVTIIEFKLTTLAGFVLVPFALWGRTSFLAERVLGNVVSSGIKVMVLAVIVGIGANFFGEFSQSLQGSEPDLAHALSMVLAALSLFGLGIFGPSIASGLVSGAPQLGAGAAVGTALGAGAVVAVGAGAAAGAAGAIGSGAMSAMRAGTSMGSAASTAYKLGQEGAGSTSIRDGLGGVAHAAGNAMRNRLSGAAGLGDAANEGRQAAFDAMTNHAPSPPSQSSTEGRAEPPAWARSLKQQQDGRHHRQVVAHALREGDRGGASAAPDIKEKED